MRISHGNIVLAAERDFGLELFVVELSTKTSHAIAKFRCGQHTCLQNIVRIVSADEYLQIIVTSNSVFYLAWCEEYGYLLFPSRANSTLSSLEQCLQWDSILIEFGQYCVKMSGDRHCKMALLTTEVRFLLDVL